MCGRASLATPPDDLAATFGLDEVPPLLPRFNIAPSQPIAVVRTPGTLELLRWGLPAHGKSPGINVRLETVARAPAYRSSFRSRRCLVVVDGFYEWKREGKAKQPFYVRRADRRPFALAGIWGPFVTKDGEVLDACAVITGDPIGVVAGLHDRMPLVVPAASYATWLDASARVDGLLVMNDDGLVAYPVGAYVNRAENDDARCIEPSGEALRATGHP